MKRIIGTMAVLAVALGGPVALAESASAHTPNESASCDGVRVQGTAYDGTKANVWSVTINGKTTSGTFGATLDKTIPVPQGGATSSWSATVKAYDGNFASTKSGSVGPCGTKPTPPPPPAPNPPAPTPPPSSTSGSTSTSTSSSNAGATASTTTNVTNVTNVTVIVKVIHKLVHKGHHKKPCKKHHGKAHHTHHHAKPKPKGCGCK